MGAMVVVAVVAIAVSRQVGATDDSDEIIRDAKPMGTFFRVIGVGNE